MFGKRDNEGGLQARIHALNARRERPALAPVTPAAPPAQAEPKLTSTEPRAEVSLEEARLAVEPAVAAIDTAALRGKSRAEVARHVDETVRAALQEKQIALSTLSQRDLITLLVNSVVEKMKREAPAAEAARSGQAVGSRAAVDDAIKRIYPLVMERIDPEVAAKLQRAELARQLQAVIGEILIEQKIQLNQLEQRDLVTVLLDDMLGLGPLEPLLADETISDIMVNGPKQVYVERRGKLELTDVVFRDNNHVMGVATRIVTGVGRRIDESSPLVDARLADGSRVNIIAPPLAIDGTSISIRKFSKKTITLDSMAKGASISPEMAVVLKIAARSRLNILISGGTGSGKTTTLNAMSQMIDEGERICTIEDAAELQLQQPHVVRLETRPPNLEGKGEITMRDLVKNTLRMRPDRIILGEIRGAEALDMLQAMNTGHDGSLCTIHANRPREALTRLENMVGMSGVNLPAKAVRQQIAAAVHMVVQVSRMRDGARRIIAVTEIVGMEGEIITTQDLFTYQYEGEGEGGKLKGSFKSTGLRPHFTPRAEYYGLDRALMEAMG
ncbi:MAG TPA: CpaF family protein [Stellaceae bacterium]|nr:CpaF family protein [Stellaceae bacterium]